MNAAEFAAVFGEALNENAAGRPPKVDDFLANISWDKTFAAMKNLIYEAINTKKSNAFAD